MTETPARVRTDVQYGGTTTTARQAGIDPQTVRRLGIGLTTGTLAWAASIFVFTTVADGWPGRIGDLTGLAFQLGVFCLLTVQFKTQAIGVSRAARVALRVEAVILGIASIWSLLHGVLPSNLQDAAWLVPLDICWPLSMLGMAVIAVKLAFTGRWRGALRWWPLIAESWAVVTVPSFILLGDQAARWVGGFHLLIGYATLGLLLARRPQLVVPQD
ncbi:hypothetical protein EV646_12222 [Kribbella antiqua]|uniref:Uncharacterized protein n=1 Tax=Kribbella antiqua TaxID=2512217 RepID=A0A4R2I2B9_9ACTN|nr:hypothetical protein [Kribbella antiqua]TCO37796.1 hypothetical protein EV646_12222 [Kribbella antiqua]